MHKLSEDEKTLIALYGELFVSHGGNDVAELIERKDVTYDNNPVVAEMQGACYSQLRLIQNLRDKGFLKDKMQQD